MTVSHIGIVTLHVLVNTADVVSTERELRMQASMHPTSVDVHVVRSSVFLAIERDVEQGIYQPGDMAREYHFTQISAVGETSFHTVIEPTL